MEEFLKNISVARKFGLIIGLFSFGLIALFVIGFFGLLFWGQTSSSVFIIEILETALVVTAAVFLGAGVHFAYQVSAYFSGELVRLRHEADKITLGDFSNLGSIYADNSGDEIGQLKSSFAAMAYKLSESYLNLDQKIQERTQQLQDANANLREALETKSEFLRIANHQLNTPLAIMNNAYAMVQDKTLTPKEAIKYWGGGLGRMNQVVKDIWNVLQLEGDFAVVLAKSDIAVAIKKAVEDKQKVILATGKPVTLIIEPPSFSMPLVLCDIKKMNDVICNLLDNALLYTPKGSITVFYELIADGAYLKVNVADSGIGFSKEDQVSMGQKFYRAKEAMLLHPDGSGLGLFICRLMVESNGGKLRYESAGVGKGSTFSFTLQTVNSQSK